MQTDFLNITSLMFPKLCIFKFETSFILFHDSRYDTKLSWDWYSSFPTASYNDSAAEQTFMEKKSNIVV